MLCSNTVSVPVKKLSIEQLTNYKTLNTFERTSPRENKNTEQALHETNLDISCPTYNGKAPSACKLYSVETA